MHERLHPDAVTLLEDRNLMASCDEMEKNVGRAVRFKGPWTKARLTRMGTSARDHTFEIIGVQKIWDGRLAYRVLAREYEDTFGRPATADEIDFLDN